MKTKTYYILAKLENGNSRIHATEATSREAATSWARANGLEVQRVYDALQIRDLRYAG
jgi:hypothetical protein